MHTSLFIMSLFFYPSKHFQISINRKTNIFLEKLITAIQFPSFSILLLSLFEKRKRLLKREAHLL